MTAATDVVTFARKYLREDYNRFSDAFGVGKMAWCAMFASYVTREAGLPDHPWTRQVTGVRQWAIERGRYLPPTSPQVGDLACINPGGSGSHVTIIAEVYADGSVLTIGGNESGGSDEPKSEAATVGLFRVRQQRRSASWISTLDGLARPDYASTAPDTTPIGVVDWVAGGSGYIDVTGWAMAKRAAGSINVQVHVDGKPVALVQASGERPDLAFLGNGTAHGFSTRVAAFSGVRNVQVFGVSGGVTLPLDDARSVTVTPTEAERSTVLESLSSNSWKPIPFGVESSATAVTTIDGVKYVYTVLNGKVYEAASNNKWINQATGITTGTSAIAVTAVDGARCVFTLNDGRVWAALSSNGWTNLPTAVTGATALTATSIGDNIYLYTLINGMVYEAGNKTNWTNLPTGVTTGTNTLSAVITNGARCIFTLNDGRVWAAMSSNKWTNLPTAVTGATALTATSDGSNMWTWTICGGKVFVASGGNNWQNLATGTSGRFEIAATFVNGGHAFYTR